MEIVLFLELNVSITHQSCIHSIFLSFFIIFKSFYSFVGIFSYFLNLYVYVNEASVEIFFYVISIPGILFCKRNTAIVMAPM